MNIKLMSQASLILMLSSCATVDKWFAPDGVDLDAAQETPKTQDDIAATSNASERPVKSNVVAKTPTPNPTSGNHTKTVQNIGKNPKNVLANAPHKGSMVAATGPSTMIAPSVQHQPQGQHSHQQGMAPVSSNPLSAGSNVSHPQAMSKTQVGQGVSSFQRQIQGSVENDYEVYRALNHSFIKNNSAQNQYKLLNQSVGYFVMDLIAKLSPEHYGAALIVRPMKLHVEDVSNPKRGTELITAMLATQMKDYGFQVFDSRKPKGQFSGNEIILETEIENYGDQFVLRGTLSLLNENTIAGTHNAFISDYFFRNIKDGVEVY